jgi:hypothetical protein
MSRSGESGVSAGMVAPLAQQALGDVVLAAQLGDRTVATERGQHDLDLLLGRELPVLAVVAQHVLPSVERPMLESVPAEIYASPYGLGSDPARHPEHCQRATGEQANLAPTVLHLTGPQAPCRVRRRENEASRAASAVFESEEEGARLEHQEYLESERDGVRVATQQHP